MKPVFTYAPTKPVPPPVVTGVSLMDLNSDDTLVLRVALRAFLSSPRSCGYAFAANAMLDAASK